MKVRSYLHGIYPRSERLVRATRDHQRGRATLNEREQAFAADLADLVSLEEESGLDLYSDGLLGWRDIFRPLVEAHPALEAGGLVRWFDTNSFYRAPQLVSPVAAPLGDLEAVQAGAPRPRVATLPGPFLFSRACQGATDQNVLMAELVRFVLRPVAERAVAAGCELVHLEEPWVVTHQLAAADWSALGSALGSLRDGLGVEVVLHTSFGDAGPVVGHLRQLPVDALGVDLVQTDPHRLGRSWAQGLVLGCVDGRSSLVESAATTVKVALEAAQWTGAPAVYLTPAMGLELVPQQIAAAKVRVLGEAAARLKDEVS